MAQGLRNREKAARHTRGRSTPAPATERTCAPGRAHLRHQPGRPVPRATLGDPDEQTLRAESAQTLYRKQEQTITICNMKKILLLLCLVLATTAAQAQFEKGKWLVNPAVTGLDLTYDTESKKASFGFQAQGGAFLADNIALLINAGAGWNQGDAFRDQYFIGVGGRYYFEQVGVYAGANLNLERYTWDKAADRTNLTFGLEVGYAFFLSKSVALEPAVYWNVNADRSRLGLKLGFGFYF